MLTLIGVTFIEGGLYTGQKWKHGSWQLLGRRPLQYIISDQIDYQIGVHYLTVMQMLHTHPAMRLIRVSQTLCQETKKHKINTGNWFTKYIRGRKWKHGSWQLLGHHPLQYIISDRIDYQIGVHYLIVMQMLHACPAMRLIRVSQTQRQETGKRKINHGNCFTKYILGRKWKHGSWQLLWCHPVQGAYGLMQTEAHIEDCRASWVGCTRQQWRLFD